MRGWLLSALLLFSIPTFADDAAQQLFEARCATCHQLPEPSMLNAQQWQRVMLTMQKRMQHSDITPLTEAEFSLIHGYLEQAAND